MSSQTATTVASTSDLTSPHPSLSRLSISHDHHPSTSSGASHCHVRFDTACIVIPELSPNKKHILGLPSRPRILDRISSRSYSQDGDLSPLSPDADEKERGRSFQFRLPGYAPISCYLIYPTKLRPSLPRKRRSTSRGEAGPSSPTSPTRERIRKRSTSMPVQFSTVPLRECCKACIPIVDAFLSSPSQPEVMSSGALRLHLQSTPRTERVKVDEIDSICDAPPRLSLDLSKQTCLAKECILDEDEDDLFPLPSPSPRNSPSTSPNASLTNLSSNTTTDRRVSPLSNSHAIADEEHTQPITIPLPPVTLPPHNHSLPPSRGTFADSSDSPRRPNRRTSFSSLGETISRGSSAVLRGFAEMRLSP